MSKRFVNAGINVTPETLAQLQAEAERSGQDRSAFGRRIVEAHFAGQSVESVRQELTDLAEAIDELRAESRTVDSDGIARLEEEIRTLQKAVQLLSAAVHHTVGILFDQTQPTPEQAAEAVAGFEALRELYQSGD